MKIGRIILSGIVFAVISQIIRTIESIATMGFYTDPNYFQVWSKIMMPGPGPPGTEFFVLSIAFAIITGIIFAAVFEKIKPSLIGRRAIDTGLYFGALLFVVAGIPFTLTMFLLINIPAVLLAAWALSSLVIYLIGGIAIAKLMQ